MGKPRTLAINLDSPASNIVARLRAEGVPVVESPIPLTEAESEDVTSLLKRARTMARLLQGGKALADRGYFDLGWEMVEALDKVVTPQPLTTSRPSIGGTEAQDEPRDS